MPPGLELKEKIALIGERWPELIEEAKEWIRKSGNGDPQARGEEGAGSNVLHEKAAAGHPAQERQCAPGRRGVL
ncbi:hypothetical protein MPNT_230021 [Candidatus Methylacidithermus pantelleriae]|uniref:Uncharacterized protein n=1 Tax=Candidatus Methylacidithermus pantelleriae TaxID=2744239 RepID=A0A8J2FSP2_9BACT|nr:hypothetical protein MPNT_230021 [Candidatus Methylacidithermus pantelleriae]